MMIVGGYAIAVISDLLLFKRWFGKHMHWGWAIVMGALLAIAETLILDYEMMIPGIIAIVLLIAAFIYGTISYKHPGEGGF